MVDGRSCRPYSRLPLIAYDILPLLSDSWKVDTAPAAPFSSGRPVFSSRCAVCTWRFSTMLMPPAIAWVLYSAVAARMISMRSTISGDTWSSEKPGGAGSPFSRICV
jgi:hypothetical protein